jgi:putative membrane protein
MPSDPAPAVTAPAGPVTSPRRLHVLSPVFLLIGNARQLILPLIAGVAVSRTVTRLLPLLFLVLLVYTVLQWWRRTWWLDGTVLRVDEGVLNRTQRVLPLARIQQVGVQRKLTHRLLGVATLKVEAAGGDSGSEVDLAVMGLAEAGWLRETLLAARGTAPTQAEAPPERLVVSLSLGEVALAGITSARAAAVLAVIGSLQQYLPEFDVIRWIVDRLETNPLGDVGPTTVGLALLALAVVWLALSAGSYILTDYGFTMTIKGGDVVVRRGLLERREAVVPLARVQVVRIDESLPRLLLGRGSVRVQRARADGREAQGAGRVAIPILPADRFAAVLGELLPGAVPLPELSQHPLAARRRAVIRRTMPVVVVAGILAVAFRPWGALALLAVPLAVAAGLAAYRSLGNAHAGGYLYTRHGAVVRRTAVVPGGKAQSLRASSTPFQRRSSLATLHVDVAGGGGVPRVGDESDEAVARLLTRLRRAPAT